MTIQTKKLREITLAEWVLFNWIEVTYSGAAEREFIKGQELAPNQIVDRADQYREWLSWRRRLEIGEREQPMGFAAEASRA